MTQPTVVNTSSDRTLSNAIAKIEELTLNGCKPQIHTINAYTNDGSRLEVPLAFVPDGNGKVRPISLLDIQSGAYEHAERVRLNKAVGPDERRGIARHETLESFIAHVNHFKDPEHSAVWASRSPVPQLVAVIDYHEKGNKGTPRWGRHQAVYPCPLSEAWKAWGGGQPLTFDQEQLGAFLQSRDMDLTEGSMRSVVGGPERKAPSPTWLLGMASNLEVFSSTSVSRKVDQNTGRTMLQYVENAGVQGEIIPPSGFLIQIPILEDAEAQVLEVRLSFKVPKGASQATFTLQIHDGDRLLREAFSTVVDRVRTDTGLIVFQGTPEK